MSELRSEQLRIKRAFEFIGVVYNAIKEFEDNEVPEEYWKEQLKWAFFNGSKEYGDPEEKMQYIESVVQECTANYLEDQQ